MTSLPPLSRRAVLRGGVLVGAALFVPLSSGPAAAVAVQVGAQGFLTEDELATLRAVVDRFVPGPPEDVDDGALVARCAEAIDALLAAFAVDPPLIFAGAPFSDRGGAPRNDFVDFLPLDAYEQAAWRLRIEGSLGRPEREFNGPVTGFQQVYRDGLAALDEVSGGSFAALPVPARELALRSDDPAVQALVDVAFPHTLELLYGAPEYGGNLDLLGWRYTGYDGDTLPRGYTREEVENPGSDGTPAPVSPVSQEQLAAIAPLGSHEAGQTLLLRSGGTAGGLQREMADLLAAAAAARIEQADAAAAIAAVLDQARS
jgi:hypothetical protein